MLDIKVELCGGNLVDGKDGNTPYHPLPSDAMALMGSEAHTLHPCVSALLSLS